MTKPRAHGWRLFISGALVGTGAGYVLHNLVGPHQSLLTSKLLDWPFLTFVLVAGFVILFFDALTAAMSRGELTIGWGKDQSISIRNLSSAVSGEIDPIKEDLAALKEAFVALQAPVHDSLSPGATEPSPTLHSAQNRAQGSEEQVSQAKLHRLREALINPKYKWRSIERLASIIGSSEDDALNLLLTMDDVRLSRSMTGFQIAGLRSRVGSA